MNKFLVLYHAPVSVMEQMASSTPQQMQAVMNAWMGWAKKAGNAVVDLGLPLGAGKTITQASVKDSQSSVSGFSILQADSVDALSGLLKEHPHLQMPGASIEVFESVRPPGM